MKKLLLGIVLASIPLLFPVAGTLSATSYAAASPAVAIADAQAQRPNSSFAGTPPSPVHAASVRPAGREENLTMMGDVVVHEGEVHTRDLVVIGGTARVLGEVRGDLVVVCGTLYLSGSAARDVVSVFSKVELADGAEIGGDFVNVLGSLKRMGEIDVHGEFVNIGFLNLSGFKLGEFPGGFIHLLQIIKAAKLAVLFLIIILIAALAPRRVAFAGNAFATDWPKALLYGFTAYIMVICISVVLCITIIGIPVAIVLFFALQIAKWMGLTAIFFLVGDRIGRNLFSREFSLFPSILIGYLIFGLLRFIPLFMGELIWFALAVLAVGIALSTRFGTGEPWFRSRNRVTPPVTPEPGPLPPPGGPPPGLEKTPPIP